MLSELRIKDFAIIDQLEVQFESGLTAFTGETGAGKSIIIDAVETLVGGRADATLVRSGAKRAIVEATFQIPSSNRNQIEEILSREDLLDDPHYVTISREINPFSRNVARVNGRSVNVSILRELGEHLVDVHGQSEHLSLLRVNQHLALLDRFASSIPQNPAEGLLASYRENYTKLLKVRRELNRLEKEEQNAAQQEEMLKFQIKEIEAAHLRIDEEEHLKDERNRLSNAEALTSLAQEALLSLDEGTPDAPSATDLIGKVVEAFVSLARLDPSQLPLSDEAQIQFENLNDLARNLRTYLENIEYNPKRLDQVEERLALLHNLRRKYGESIPQILEHASNAQKQLDEITTASEKIAELKDESGLLLSRLSQIGLELSKARRDAAKVLEDAMGLELQDLQMSGARFKVEFTMQADSEGIELSNGKQVAFHALGLENIEFLIAPNPGEGFKPLVKIASGGETSRLMLALKNVLVKADQIPTLIFDEIDQGIGGRVGSVVGEKLWRLGRQHQVLCITHLPQLAAFGEHHFHVEKRVAEGRTITKVSDLRGDSRLNELAQMLGSLSESTIESARELIQNAEQHSLKPL